MERISNNKFNSKWSYFIESICLEENLSPCDGSTRVLPIESKKLVSKLNTLYLTSKSSSSNSALTPAAASKVAFAIPVPPLYF